MRYAKLIACASVFLLAASGSASSAQRRVHRGPTAPRLFRSRAITPRSHPKIAVRIDPERATQIQAALIASSYLSGAPSGAWDTQTQSAMEKFQADNGWQTKLIPDARAIIKLGLGPANASATDAAANSAETRDITASPSDAVSALSPSNQ